MYLDTVRSLDDPERLRRLHELETVGLYQLEEVDLRHSSGRVIPTLISTQRRTINGERLDIEIIIDNSERKAVERRILEAAYTDVVTGLPNRAAFDHRLRNLSTQRPSGQGLALAYIDLNGFKSVNDRYGHLVGDRVLRGVAERLRAYVDPQHFAARIGGDEFVLLSTFPRDEPPTAAELQAIAEAICAVMLVDDSRITIGAALGVALTGEAVDADALLRRADILMYAAKATGRAVAVDLKWIDGT
ncbi:GGDEF domain-containing protein [Ancylobacter oerskovii]|uniref:Diguanylate cyclase domain-containing protein n=1 Tax=Ancylobacter oerskovii TaxID=459519 RepID=A0ABW4YXQ1_9HYPH|nr:GGDEF domain-containing protein [Ancylobacter oerskovii]MBS7542070.1 GGDEF domain-containing protein [Ancylobacter oerskovii]